MQKAALNIDPRELAKFEASAERWWDPKAEFRPLHDINPLRLRYVSDRASLAGARVLDVGCGGGILSEAMAKAGAMVTGIDASEPALAIARTHAEAGRVAVDYRCIAAEDYAEEAPGVFDIVTCMELLEHVPDPQQMVLALGRLVRPGGAVFLSTLNRTSRAFLLAVAGAEYALGLLPRGTHDYARFIRPAELAHWLRCAGLELIELHGMAYNPCTHAASLSRDVSVNYIVHARRHPD
jgi:2-polyprenyl-6-hydroxyphenyl methylase / 3-demethylubiquinone-9 3-methyltransferase